MTFQERWDRGLGELKTRNSIFLIWLGLALLFLGLFIQLSRELYEDQALDLLDKKILVFISDWRVDALKGVAVDLSALGSPTVITLFSLIGIVLLWLNHDRRGYSYLAIGSAGAGIGTFLLKHLFTRDRPSVVPRLVEVSGFSYPSGHSLGATSFYLLLMFLAWRHYIPFGARLGLLACAIVLIVGVCFARVYLGVHYPSDVLSGICLGAAWVCFLTGFSYGSQLKR